MKILTKQQVFTYICLVILLASRMLIADVVLNFLQLFHAPALPTSWVSGIELMQAWTLNLYINWSFILVGVVLIINRNDLQSLNIDGAFVAIFAAGSLTYWTYHRWPSGWIALLIPFAMYIFYKRHELRFAKVELVAGQITVIVVIIFFLGLLFKYDSLTIEKISQVAHLAATQVPSVLIIEIIFRGLLWKFLTHLNWSALKIIGLQAFLFWISQISQSDYMFTNPILFWITIPVFNIILGIIVWRSRSLTVSFFAHIFFNYLLMFYQI